MRLLAHLVLAWKGFYRDQCKSVNDRVIRHQISVSLRIYWFLKLLPIVIFLVYQKFVSLIIIFNFVLRLNEILFINLFQREFLCVTLQQYTIKLLLEEKLSDPSRPRVSLFCDMSTEHWHYYYFHSAETLRLLYA